MRRFHVKPLLFAFLLAVAGPAGAEWFSGLDRAAVAREAAYDGLLLVDYGQTLDIKNHPGSYETNPLLGKHPSDEQIRRHFGAALVIHGLVSWALPDKPINRLGIALSPRALWQYVTLGVEGAVVASNFGMGLKVRF